MTFILTSFKTFDQIQVNVKHITVIVKCVNELAKLNLTDLNLNFNECTILLNLLKNVTT